jgi:RNA polymerase sigma factor (sigma-70 family)
MNGDERTDDALADAARIGEQEAFAQLYDRYFPQVYDFAIRVTRVRDAAAAVTQSAFYMALQWLRSGEPGAPFKVQIYALAHHDLTQRARQTQDQVLEGEEAFVATEPSSSDSPALAAELPELGRIAWQAARELRTDEYELLDLHARREMSVTDVGSVARARGDAVVNRLGRVRQMFEEAFTVSLLVQRGRRECLDLDFLVDEQATSSSQRRRIASHLASCDVCQATRGRYPNGVDVLARLALVAPPEGWQDIIIARLLDPTPAAAAVPPATAVPPPEAWTSSGGGGGFSEWWDNVWHGNGKWWLLGLVGAVLLVGIILFATVCGSGALDDGPDGPTQTPTSSATASPSATTTPTTTATPTETLIPTDTPPNTNTPPPPTNTPIPSNTPVPPPPTDTPPPGP